MELYAEILTHLLSSQRATVEVTFPGLAFSASEIVESAAYCALSQIQAILKDSSLSDGDCCEKIEEIIYQFERLGSDCGSRRDFG